MKPVPQYGSHWLRRMIQTPPHPAMRRNRVSVLKAGDALRVHNTHFVIITMNKQNRLQKVSFYALIQEYSSQFFHNYLRFSKPVPSSRLQKTIVSDCHEISQYLHWVSLHKYIDALAFCPGTKISPPWKHFNLENQEMFLILFYLYLVVLSLFFTLSLVWKVSWKLCYEVCFTNVLGYRWSVVDWRAGALDTALEITEREVRRRGHPPDMEELCRSIYRQSCRVAVCLFMRVV